MQPPQAAPAQPVQQPASVPSENTYNSAVLRVLNKVTAQTETLTVPVGTVGRFGNLEIVVLSCAASPPDQQPNDAVLMDVRVTQPGEAPQRIFVGWMFSASPSVSSLQHPVYDVTVVKCEQQDLEDDAEKSAAGDGDKSKDKNKAAPKPDKTPARQKPKP
jgi:hypothetical protein